MKALITTGGRGTRLRPLTHTQNKHLIPIANKPIVHYALEYVRDAGITEVGIVTHAASQEVQQALGDGSAWGLNLTYIPQEAPLGLAHVVKIAQPFIGDSSFVFYLGDNMVVGGIARFLKTFQKEKSNCHLTLARVRHPEQFGVPEMMGKRIVSIVEKPQQPKSNFAVAGIYFYDSHIFEAVQAISPSARGELEISDAHQYLLEHGYRVTYSEITGWWKDTGKPSDLLEANRLVLAAQNKTEIAGEVDHDSQIVGPVIIEAGARIVSSYLRGPVIIGQQSCIENSYIGPFTSISHHCKIVNSEVEYSIVLDHAAILDVAIRIESSLLGSDVQIVCARDKPRTHRFLLGDQSRVEIV